MGMVKFELTEETKPPRGAPRKEEREATDECRSTSDEVRSVKLDIAVAPLFIPP
jgi:hypothetical protein